MCNELGLVLSTIQVMCNVVMTRQAVSSYFGCPLKMAAREGRRLGFAVEMK